LSIEVRENESLENALKRFKRQLQHLGILEEARRHERYEKPSERRRRMLAASIRRARRAAAQQSSD
jgi:small subunit ribosomal protein S21